MKLLEKTIISGILPKYIEEYFKYIAYKIDDKGVYHGPNWQVEIIPQLDRQIGSINVSVTKVIFIGEEVTVDELMSNFRLKFLSAGG